MAEILDVINRFTYQVEDAELQQATQQIQAQVQSITVMAQRMQNLQNAFNRTADSEIEKRTRIAGLIQRQRQAIDQTTQSMAKQVSENQKLQQAITREIGLLNTLDLKLKSLREEQRKAFDPKDIQRFQREIEATQAKITSLTTRSGRGILGGVGSAILQGVGIGTGIGLVTQGVGALQQFISESSKLAAEAEGVTAAFERLNQPELLGNLREATKGTVSDLELMKQAIQFNNFGLPLDKLATALEFARIRARDTGQSVDYLVQSIVTGIGRQSPLILDNLGINAKRVSDEFQRTGNFAEAAFKIIQEESRKAGKDLTTFSEVQARLNAEIENSQTKIGEVFNRLKIETLALVTANGDLLESYYRSLQEREAEAYEKGNTRLRQRLTEQLDMYGKFFKQVEDLRNRAAAGVPSATFETFTQEGLKSLNRTELQALRETGNEVLGIATNDQEIKRVKDRIRQIDQALERYSITVKKTTQATREFKKETFKPKEQQGTFFLDTQGAGAQTPEIDTGALERAIRAANQAQEEREAGIQADEKILEERQQAYKDAYSSIVNIAVSSFQMIYEARLRFLDMEFEAQSERVNQARLLAEKGNTEQYDIEVQRLNAIQRERERIAKQQIQLNAVIQASNSAVALIEAIGAIVKAAALGDPYTIAARVAAAVAALIGGVASLKSAFTTEQGFKDGVIDLDGEGNGRSDSISARLSKGESVITAEATRKNKSVLQAINDGAVFSMPNTHTVTNTSFGNTLDMGGVIKELKSVKQAIADNQLRQDIFFNEYGVGVLTEKAMKANRRKWS